MDHDRMRQLRHWAARCKRMPKRRVSLAFPRSFTAEELRAAANGMIPLDMDYKWIGLLTEGAINFHRSWTGFHIYSIPLRSTGDGVEATRLLVNRNPGQYGGTDDAEDLRFAGWLLDRLLAGEPA